MQNDIVFVSRYFNIYNITWNNHHINSFYKEYGNILKKLQEKSKKWFYTAKCDRQIYITSYARLSILQITKCIIWNSTS